LLKDEQNENFYLHILRNKKKYFKKILLLKEKIADKKYLQTRKPKNIPSLECKWRNIFVAHRWRDKSLILENSSERAILN